MGAVRGFTWRGSLGCATLWLMLAAASTLEVYDEVPPGDSYLNDLYQDDNHLDTVSELETQNTRRTEDLLLREILKALRQKMDYRKTWRWHMKPKLIKEDYRNLELEKDGVVKRLTDVLRGSRMQYRPSLRPQQKWKIKKGKVIGSQMVCYFKLCAFRSPA